MPTTRKSHLDPFAIALLLACCMFWGFQQVLVKATMAEVPPVFQACLRFAVSSLAVALGLAAVFAASTTAFTVLKVLGATYLAYLAWQAFRAPVGPLALQAEQQPSMLRMFVRGWVMNLTNPKVVFFFLALLPQFVHAERGAIALQLCVLGGIFIVATLVAFGTITYFAAAVSSGLRSSASAQRWLNRMAGTVFLGMAARLALAER